MQKLKKENIEDIFALTPIQEGMLLHYLQDPDSDYYFEQLSLGISGKIDKEIFEQSWNFVIANNEMLRAVFRWEKLEKPIQIILKEHKPRVRYYDFPGQAPHEIKIQLEEIKIKDRKEKFDLRQVPFRVTLLKVENTKYEMIISNHHILYDGWSNRIILKEFFSAYNDLTQQKSPLKPVKHHYKEYTKRIQRQDTDKLEKYWTDYLAGFEDKSELSIKKKRGKKINAAPAGNCNCKVKFSRQLKEKSGIFTKHHKITLAGLLYSAWGILVQGYNNSEDVVFGTTVSGRSSVIEGIENIVGLFINTVPLRVRTNSNDREKVKDFLYRVNKNLREREEYESVSLVEIKEYGELVYEDELFDTIFVIENYPLEQVLSGRNNPGSLSIDAYSIFEMTHYDLTVGVTLMDDIEIEFTYNKDQFEESIITGLSRHFIKIVEDMVNNPGKELTAIEILSEAEKNKILFEFNNTAADYPGDKTIHQLFVGQVERNPDHIALIGQSSKQEGTRGLAPLSDLVSMTYRELYNQSEGLACILTGRGVSADAIVGIMVERSIEMVIGILGILKAGGAYLPIDPAYPEERKKYMLKDSNAEILLTGREITAISSPRALYLSEGRHPDFPASQLPGFPASLSSSLAYIIYTSGTTGKPKGVMIEHSALMNRLYWVRDKYRLNERDVILQATSFVFDVSVCEMFRWIPAGGKLCLLSPGGEKDPGQIIRTIARNGVTTADFIPGMLTQLLDYAHRQNLVKELAGLRWVWTGVEVVDVELVKEFNETLHRLNRTRLINAYGPTESTVDVTYFDCSHIEAYDAVPIGRPMANVQVYILSINGAVQPVGLYGQLCIAGKGLARGYLNNPKLTAEKFCLRRPGALFEKTAPGPRKNFLLNLPEGHSHHSTTHHSSLYQTGDLACWLPDGNIRFLGRIDHQVKIRGHRVELGEIESRLLRHEKIKDAVAIIRGGNEKGKYLCAYIVPHASETLSIDDVKEYLELCLPTYMVPTYFLILAELPLTSSGKIDRKALPPPKVPSAKPYTAPGNQKEAQLVDIWAEVLGIDSGGIGIDDNFFELGGHSLKILGVIGRIHKKLNIKIPFTGIFDAPTIRELARYIGKKEQSRHDTVPLAEKKEYYNLSSVQGRLYFLYKMTPHGIAYNMSGFMRMEGHMETGKLETVFRKLIARHESLRTSFVVKGEEPCQRIHDEGNIDFRVTSYRLTTNKKLPVKKIIENFIQPFDISRVPLLRVGLIEEKYREYILVVDMHHIISDGISIDVLTREFAALYRGDALPVPAIQYRDFSEWHNGYAWKEFIKEQETYWLKQFAGEVPVLDLPFDFPRPLTRNFAGHTVHFEMNKEDTAAIRSLGRDRDVTLFMLLLSFYTVFLSKLSGQEDIVVGTPIAGRRHTDLDGIIGMFVNTLALRNFPIMEKTCHQFLGEIKENTIKAFENQDYLYEDLVEQMEVERDTGRNPLFDAMFVLQNVDAPGVEIPGLKIAPYHYESRISKFDLTLTAVEKEDRLAFTFEYCTDLFKEETIRRFIGFFKKTVSFILENVKTRISGIEIISGEEKNRILQDFNDTGAEYPRDKTIHQLFVEQVQQRPNQVALIGGNSKAMGGGARLEGTRGLAPLPDLASITYRELNNQSHRLAYILIEKDVKPDIIVGIMVERSIEMIIGILGILKAGGAYLPIDPDYPEERKKYMLKDSNAEILLTSREITAISSPQALYLSEEGHHTVFPSSRLPSFSHLPSFPRLHLSPAPAASLAYIMYTSGTTGGPKGVLVTQRNVARLVKNTNYIELTEKTRILQTGAPVFDATTFEIWASLLNGGQLVLTGKETIMDARQLGRTLDHFDINTLWLSAPLFNQLSDYDTGIFSTLDYLLVGGDVLSIIHINRVRKALPGLIVINGYGPTENTTFSTTYHIREEFEGSIPIGKPIANSTAYIVDGNGHFQPIGVSGELLVGGDGVSCGYLNDPELTAERFDRDLWDYRDYHDGYHRSHKSYPPYMLYKTGDLARWLSDGNIEFLGRIDHQVKIRGFRVELEEIENQLLTHGKIKEAIVIAREYNNDKYLCAYMVANPGETNPIDQSGLREHLANHLPDYMVPAYFVQLDNIPLTPNGKVDRKALPEPEMKTAKNYTAPRNEIEKKLAGIWSEILDVEKEKIGIHDNFFHLGGHSLKATIMTAKLHRTFDVNITLSEIFKMPTIRGLAHIISKSQKSQFIELTPTEEKDFYEPSFNQKRLWFIHQMEPRSSAFNIPGRILLDHYVENKWMEKTLARLFQRHESFRTGFKTVGGQPVQYILKEVPVPLKKIDISFMEEKEKQNELERIFNETVVEPFDLTQAPLFRAVLLKLDSHLYEIIFNIHHIITDGWSMEIIKKDFYSLYEERRTGKLANLEPLPFRYRDFSEYHNRRPKDSLKKNDSYRFWKSKLQAGIPNFKLPGDFPGGRESKAGAGYTCFIDTDITQSIKLMAKRRSITLFTVMFSVYLLLLSRFSGEQEVVISIIGSGRPHASLHPIVGFFVNSIICNIKVDIKEPFHDFLERVNREALELFQHQDYPLETVFEELMMRYPGIPTAFNMLHVRESAASEELEQTKSVHIEYSQETKFDLEPYITEYKNGIHISWSYKKDMFLPGTIAYIAEEYIKLIVFFTKNQAKNYIDYRNLNAGIQPIMRRRPSPLEQWHGPLHIFPTIPAAFEHQVKKTPDRIAIRMGDQHFTYAELDRYSNGIACLIGHFINSNNERIGLLFEHGYDMVAAIFGTLKSGNAYVPLSTSYPVKRLSYMLFDSESSLILTNTRNIQTAARLAEENHINFWDVSGMNPNCLDIYKRRKTEINGDSPAYILYTSGSTGNPKGVVQNHGNVLYYIENMTWILALSPDDKMTLISSFCHDASIPDIYGALLNGASLYPYDVMNREENVPGLPGFLMAEKITVWHSVPSLFSYFIKNLSGSENFSGVRFILLGGEPVRTHEVHMCGKFFPNSTMVNIYGQTESTLSSLWLIKPANFHRFSKVSIGEPLDNTEIFLLDEENNLVEPFGTGEIVVACPHLALEYWKNDEATQKAFYTHPVYGRMYRTGDLGRLLPDFAVQGAYIIEFIGRNDQQVKIRGYRIELGEIESQLLKHKDIKESLVICKTDKRGESYLCAYIVSNNVIPLSMLREYLSAYLPDYMIPSHFMRLEKFPLTPTGKIDGKALPDPGIKTGERYIAPRNLIEEKLVAMWAEVLERDSATAAIWIDDNFFRLGGHSLNAVALMAKIHKEFSVKIRLKDIFEIPTIREIGRYIQKAGEYNYTAVESVEKKEYHSLSSAQTRMYILQQMHEQALGYNIPAILLMEGDIDKNRILYAFTHMIKRHDCLRTSFKMVEGEPVQVIHRYDEIDFEIETIDLKTSRLPFSLVDEIIKNFIRPFDLSRPPLFRVGLISIEDGKHILIFDIHHIIADGVSCRILDQELLSYYAGEELPLLKLQYKDYSEWQNSKRGIDLLKHQKSFWLKQFEREIPILNLPADYDRPGIFNFQGNSIHFSIEKEVCEQMTQLTGETSTTLTTFLFSIYYILLSKYSGQKDLVVGITSAGRHHADFQNIIGMFVNMLPIRTQPGDNKTYREFLLEVKEKMLSAVENQDYQFDELIGDLGIKRDSSRNPLVDVLFNVTDIEVSNVNAETRLKVSSYKYKLNTAVFDLILSFSLRHGIAHMSFIYSIQLFKKKTIEKMLEWYLDILKQVLENNEIKLQDIRLSHKLLTTKSSKKEYEESDFGF